MELNINKIRGVCHNPDINKSRNQMEFELSCAKRLNINSIRFWLDENEWIKDSTGYIKYISQFAELCKEYDMTLMPIIWNGNFLTQKKELEINCISKKREYVKSIVSELKNYQNVIIWDIINEPIWNDYLRKSPKHLYDKRYKELGDYSRQLCDIFKNIFPDEKITVGHEKVEHCVTTVDLVDVISFHDYHPTRKEIKETYKKALDFSKLHGNKPVINTETGCIGRANPYDVELEMCAQYGIGWYLFNLVSEGNWADIHGLIYPDGTIRDPGVIAALYGFFRKRNSGRILANPNKEGHVYAAINKVEDALKIEEDSLFVNKEKSSEIILEAAEYCVNILESCELVAMGNLLSAQIEEWRQIDEKKRDIKCIREFAYEVAMRLKKECCIL